MFKDIFCAKECLKKSFWHTALRKYQLVKKAECVHIKLISRFLSIISSNLRQKCADRLLICIFNKGLAPSFNVASRSEAAMKFQSGIEPQLKLNMEPAALEARDILPKL